MGSAPGQPTTESPFLNLKPVANHCEGAWELPGRLSSAMAANTAYMDSSRTSVREIDRGSDRNRMQSYIRPVVKSPGLLAIMGIRAPRANR
jgi:hypothetical protein